MRKLLLSHATLGRWALHGPKKTSVGFLEEVGPEAAEFG